MMLPLEPHRHMCRQSVGSTCMPIQSLNHALTRSLTHSLTRSLALARTHARTHAPTNSLTHSFTHLPIHSPTNLSVHPSIAFPRCQRNCSCIQLQPAVSRLACITLMVVRACSKPKSLRHSTEPACMSHTRNMPLASTMPRTHGLLMIQARPRTAPPLPGSALLATGPGACAADRGSSRLAMTVPELTSHTTTLPSLSPDASLQATAPVFDSMTGTGNRRCTSTGGLWSYIMVILFPCPPYLPGQRCKRNVLLRRVKTPSCTRQSEEVWPVHKGHICTHMLVWCSVLNEGVLQEREGGTMAAVLL